MFRWSSSSRYRAEPCNFGFNGQILLEQSPCKLSPKGAPFLSFPFLFLSWRGKNIWSSHSVLSVGSITFHMVSCRLESRHCRNSEKCRITPQCTTQTPLWLLPLYRLLPSNPRLRPQPSAPQCLHTGATSRPKTGRLWPWRWVTAAAGRAFQLINNTFNSPIKLNKWVCLQNY